MARINSLALSLALLPESKRQKAIEELTDEEAVKLFYDWEFWARPKQLAPDWLWHIWLVLSGRGYGKTRIGAELVNEWAVSTA